MHLLPGRLPTLKPKVSIQYPGRNNVAYVDLEGIADDGMGYTFLIMGDDYDDFDDDEAGSGQAQPTRRDVLHRVQNFLARWLGRRRSPRENQSDITSSNVYNQDEKINTNYPMEHSVEAPEIIHKAGGKKFEIYRGGGSEHTDFPPFESTLGSSMSPTVWETLRSNSPSSARFSNYDSSWTMTNDSYTSWARRTDPSRRFSPMDPMNSSNSSAISPKPHSH